MTTCSVYRVWDDQGRLLYVGMSDEPLRRMSGHHRCSVWADKAAEIRIEWHPSREEAAAAESAAILAEDPIHNANRPGGDSSRWLRWILAEARGVHADDITTAEMQAAVDRFCERR